MHSYLIEMLECPVCHGELAWTVTERRGNRIEKAEAHCVACAATYPVREGIGLFLTPDLPRNDLWEQVDSQLPNIEQPGDLLQELRRIVAGTFLAISHFFPEKDEANAAIIRQAGLSALLFRRSALEHFASAGWQVDVANACQAKAHPTPRGVLMEGAGIDALPVAETILEWCVFVAH